MNEFGHLAQGPDGIKKLRDLILQLAVQGKLVEQDPNDEPASALLSDIDKIKANLAENGVLKKNKKTVVLCEDIAPFSIPKSWKWVALGDLGITQTGSTPKKISNVWGGNIPFVKPACIEKNKIDYSMAEGLSSEIEQEGRFAKAPSLLMVCIGTIGKSAIARQDCSFNQQINSITPYVTKTIDFINIATSSNYFQGLAWAESSSTTISILNKGKWEKLPFPLPPLAEQKRIVAKVDELMALCDELEASKNAHTALKKDCVASTLHHLSEASEKEEIKTNWSIAEGNFNNWFDNLETVKNLRATILQLAVQGKLGTNNPDETSLSLKLQEVARQQKKKIKADYVNTEFTGWDDIPSNWITTILAPIIEQINYGTSKKCGYNAGNVNVYRIPNIGKWEVDTSDLKSTNFDDREFYNLKLETGDILLIRSNGSVNLVGKPALIKESDLSSLYAGYLVRIRLSAEIFNPAYVVRLLTSPTMRTEIESYGRSTSGVNNINSRQIASLPVPIPPLEEQKRIVSKVDELMSLCDQLESQIKSSEELNRDLMASLVHHMLAA